MVLVWSFISFQLDRSRTMSQNIQICNPPSQKSSHVWGWFPWIPLLVPSHYASEVANVFTQNCIRYVDIALTYDQTLALEDFDTNKNWQMLHVQVNVLRFDTSLCPMSSSFSHIFPICFFPYFSTCFPSFSRIPSSRNPSSRATPVPKRPTVHRGEPSATHREEPSDVVFIDRSRAQKDASKTSPKRDEVLRQSKIWRCFTLLCGVYQGRLEYHGNNHNNSNNENYGTLWWTNILPWKDPPFLMGKPTISMAIFHSKMLVHQRVSAYYKMIITQIVTSSCEKNVTDYIICNVVLLYCNIWYETYYIHYIDVESMLNWCWTVICIVIYCIW